MNLFFDEREVAKILADAINLNQSLTQKDLAEYAGFSTPNVISMLKQGKTKIPLDKAGLIAEKLGLDKQDFWFKCLKEYQPNVFAEYERISLQPTLGKDEITLIKYLREKNIDIQNVISSLD
ncbi:MULTISPECIES: helix-turn-helix domain-containing protein [unclassified Acinetobacter]|uniref:helix-turn-helix domain-containing protein n=1 Tax=unclassified Acinetobacter TaxID=196816 RepID=UPI0015D3BB5C|nr:MULTISPECIES: helix-turn-helix transcriptional regulator [unclassified Acinetobacter]